MTFEEWFYKEYDGPPILGKDKDISLDDQLFDAWQAAQAAQRKKDAEKEQIYVDALEALSRLGNGDKRGNSIGNCIAHDALKAAKAIEAQED